MHRIWTRIQTSKDWKRLEEFSFLLISHLVNDLEVYFHSNLLLPGSEIDSVICLNDPKWGGDVLIEAKNRKDPNPRDLDQISGRMEQLNIKLGFLVTKYALTGKNGMLESIQYRNQQGKRIIVPLQSHHIEKFFLQEKSTKDFLLKMINTAKYHALALVIPKN